MTPIEMNEWSKITIILLNWNRLMGTSNGPLFYPSTSPIHMPTSASKVPHAPIGHIGLFLAAIGLGRPITMLGFWGGSHFFSQTLPMHHG